MQANQYVDHEVRIQLVERAIINIDKRFDRLEAKMDSNFHWVLGTILGVFGTTILAAIGGVILHFTKLS